MPKFSQHFRWNSAVPSNVKAEQPEFEQTHIVLLHILDEEDAAFQQYNSSVEFTFQERESGGNARRLKQLNTIFENAADKLSGVIREDKVIKILPAGSAERFGLREDRADSYWQDQQQHRFLSRGVFLAMFSMEKSSFIFSMAENERALRGKRKLNKNRRGETLSAELEKVISQSEVDGLIKKKKKKKYRSREERKARRRAKKDKKERRRQEALTKELETIEEQRVEVTLKGSAAEASGECKFFGDVSSVLKNLFPGFGRSAIMPVDEYAYEQR